MRYPEQARLRCGTRIAALRVVPSGGSIPASEFWRGPEGKILAPGGIRGTFAALLPPRSWPQRVLQLLAKLSRSGKEPKAHSANRNPQAVRHFLRRVMQYIPQQTRLAKIGRKLHDGICQKPSHLAVRAALLGVLLVRGDAAAERFVVLPSWFFQRRHFAVAPLPQQIDGSIRPDAPEPGPQIVPRFIFLPGELIEPHPRFE